MRHHYRHSDDLVFTMFFFKSKEKHEAKTSVMADLFTLTYTHPPPS